MFNTQVTNIDALGELRQLNWLDLYNTPVAEVTALTSLAQLTWLDLRGTNLSDRTCPVEPATVCFPPRIR